MQVRRGNQIQLYEKQFIWFQEVWIFLLKMEFISYPDEEDTILSHFHNEIIEVQSG